MLTLYLSLDPVGEGRHAGVDPRLALLPAAVPPGGDAVELEATGHAVLVDERTPRISLQQETTGDERLTFSSSE